MKWFNMSSSTYRSPVFIGLLVVMSVALVLLLHHCILVSCCNGERIRRRSRRRVPRRGNRTAAGRGVGDLSSSSRVQLVAKPVVCQYRKDEEWSEPTCPVCLADFADGEAVRCYRSACTTSTRTASTPGSGPATPAARCAAPRPRPRRRPAPPGHSTTSSPSTSPLRTS
ncbi:hypothetical protein ZWY2020_052173 [Hordeum vulgare]|nr:hypothetical protein ZWY2020_052173 [Hordeum vulgare]